MVIMKTTSHIAALSQALEVGCDGGRNEAASQARSRRGTVSVPCTFWAYLLPGSKDFICSKTRADFPSTINFAPLSERHDASFPAGIIGHFAWTIGQEGRDPELRGHPLTVHRFNAKHTALGDL